MSSSLRRPTFTERKPPPTGVVIGPLSATPFSRIDASVGSGSGLPPYSCITLSPAGRTSQSNSTPVASSTRRVASVSSGPVPSPGMRVTVYAIGGRSYTGAGGALPRNRDPPSAAAVIDGRGAAAFSAYSVNDSAVATLTLPPVSPPRAALVGIPGGRAGVAGTVQRVEELIERSAWAEAVEAIGDVHVPASSAPELALRVLFAESWARMYLGELDLAEAVAERARALVEAQVFADGHRADALFRLGCVRLKRGKVSNAVALLTEALRLGAGARLRARAYEWRSRSLPLQ